MNIPVLFVYLMTPIFTARIWVYSMFLDWRQWRKPEYSDSRPTEKGSKSGHSEYEIRKDRLELT